jgi:hypothetical protein
MAIVGTFTASANFERQYQRAEGDLPWRDRPRRDREHRGGHSDFELRHSLRAKDPLYSAD